jgi:hypothetical protein
MIDIKNKNKKVNAPISITDIFIFLFFIAYIIPLGCDTS